MNMNVGCKCCYDKWTSRDSLHEIACCVDLLVSISKLLKISGINATPRCVHIVKIRLGGSCEIHQFMIAFSSRKQNNFEGKKENQTITRRGKYQTERLSVNFGNH